MKILIKIDKILEIIQTSICVILFSLILILGSLQICSRYVFSISIPWSEEVMRFASIWLAMIGSSLTIRVDGHVSVDILISCLNSNKKKAIMFLISRLICVLFLIIYLPASIELVIKSETSRATSLPIPYSYIYMAVPIGIVMMIASYMSAIPKYTKKYLEGK